MTELLGWAINCAVPVVATIASVDSLHPNLVPGRGRKKGFTTVVNLKLPNAVRYHANDFFNYSIE